MREVKTLSEGGYTLNHSWYLDYFGLKRNSFDLFHEESRTHYPFIGRIRVRTADRNTPIDGEDVSQYSEEEYLEMLREQVAKIVPLENEERL